MTQGARDILQGHFDRLYRQRDLGVIEEGQATDAVREREFVSRVHEVFSQAEVVLGRVVEQGNEIAATFQLQGTTASGKTASMQGAGFFRLTAGRLECTHCVWDVLALYASLEAPLDGVLDAVDALERVALAERFAAGGSE